MMTVIKALYDRVTQFLSILYLLIIFIWFFAGIAFFNLRSLYVRVDQDENICSSYFICFLSHFNLGIRDGLTNGPQKLFYHSTYYYEAFIYDWIFFFFVKLILLNIVNAIIVDEFQKKNESSNIHRDQVENICYVCQLHRSKFEMKGFNFEIHSEKEHNFLDYIKYLIRIKNKSFKGESLSSSQFNISNKMHLLQGDFIPIKTSMCFQEDRENK